MAIVSVQWQPVSMVKNKKSSRAQCIAKLGDKVERQARESADVLKRANAAFEQSPRAREHFSQVAGTLSTAKVEANLERNSAGRVSKLA